MTILKKSAFLSCGIIAAALIFFVGFYVVVTANIRHEARNTLAKLNDNYMKMIESHITILGKNIESFLSHIPRPGTGGNIIAAPGTAFRVSDNAGRMLQSKIENNKKINSIYIIEPSGLILSANSRTGELPDGIAPLDAEDTRALDIMNVVQSEQTLLRWAPDNKSVSYYKPVKHLGSVAYVLYLNIDTSKYIENTMFLYSQFAEFEDTYARSLATVSLVSVGLIATTILLYMLFIGFGILKPLGKLSYASQLIENYEYISSQISNATAVINRIMDCNMDSERNLSTFIEKNTAGKEIDKKAVDGVSDLNSQIVDITQIVDEIKAVTKRTQLLSLNASTEAASIGEHGKGFVAVAEAVRMLAEQAANSALKIEKIIASISNSSDAVTETMRISEEQITYVKEMQEIFSNISSEIEAVNSIFGNVNQSLSTMRSLF